MRLWVFLYEAGTLNSIHAQSVTRAASFKHMEPVQASYYADVHGGSRTNLMDVPGWPDLIAVVVFVILTAILILNGNTYSQE